MDKFNLIVGVLAAIALVGVIWLLAIDKTVDVMLPILTALVGALVGAKKDAVANYFSKK